MEDYDYVRNMTLMFFLDRLMMKDQTRSLHDLSCQFGTKGFTKEMRQIAGGSQSGLKKFLSQYPSLFTIAEDQVSITPLVKASSDSDGSGIRDYTKEAVEFFREKLAQYGEAEVPLKSLLGHRSQAPPEVRHVSGQHSREFKEFLCKHSKVFVVSDDYVVLQSVLQKLEADGRAKGSLTRMPEEVPFDPYLTQQFISILETEITQLTPQYSSKLTIDVLFNHLKNNCNQELWTNCVKNSNDLITFLKMNSKIFLVQSNEVSLTPEREQTNKDMNLKDINSNNNNNNNNNNNSYNNSLNSITGNNNTNNKNSLTSMSSSQSSSTSTPISSPSRVNSAGSIGSVNQRIRSQIMKIVSDNSQLKYKNMTNCNNSNLSVGSTEANVVRNTRIITKTKEAEEVISDILRNNTYVAVDCEGVNLGASGQITLVQMAYMSSSDPRSSSPRICIFDVLLNSDFLTNSLKDLFESEKVIKVIHDVRNDSSCLHSQHGITIANIFDTQVAHSIIQQQNTGRPAYKAKYISLNNLCELYGGTGSVSNPKKEQMRKVYRKDQKYWSHRPLTEEMIFYAAFDVYALVPEVYKNMSKSIRTEYLPLLKQLNFEAVFAKINPEKVKQMKKQRKLDMEVTDLKLKLFNSEAKQIVLSNREIRLLRYIDLTDEIRGKIEGSQKVAKKLERIDKKCTDSGFSSACVQSPDANNMSSSDDESDRNSEIDSDVDDSLKSSDLNNQNNNLFSPSDSLISNKSCCNCVCHLNGSSELNGKQSTPDHHISRDPLCEASAQTLSTGDIVITKVFFEDNPQ